MAKSGQRRSQILQAMHCSGLATTTLPDSSFSSTLLGQNAMHIPHLLHQFSLTKTVAVCIASTKTLTSPYAFRTLILE